MAEVTSKLIVQLIDRVTAPARGVAGAVQKLNATLNKSIASNNAAMDSMRGRLVDAVAGFYTLRAALSAPVSAAINFETLMEDIGQKAEISGSALADLGRQIREVAGATNMTTTEMGRAVDAVIGLGLDPANAMAIAPAIGKVATAYRAAADDVGKAGVATLQNLKVPASEMMRAFDAMAASGKAGAFELKDMSKEFPSLAAMAQNLGITGVKGVADLAAALQITRRGAGDSSEAATNLLNVMQKVNAPATRKNFKKFGIDINKEIDKGMKAGVSPIETLAIQADTAMKKGAKLPDLFEDRQVQLGLLALIQNLQDYRKIREDALKASGMVEADYQRRVKTSASAVQRFHAAIENLNVTLGSALLPGLNDLVGILGPLANKVASLAERFPAVTRAVVATTAGLIGLRVAAIAAGYAGLFLKGGLLVLASGALGAVRGLVALINPLNLVRGAVIALNVALVTTGVGAILAGIAMAGVWIYNNWAGIKELFAGIGDAFMKGLGPARTYLEPVAALAGRIFSAISNLLGPLAATNAEWRAWGETIGGAVASAVNAVASGIERIIGLFSSALAQAQALAGYLQSINPFGGGTGVGVGNGGIGDRRNPGRPAAPAPAPQRSGSIYPSGAGGARHASVVNHNSVTVNVSGTAADPNAIAAAVDRKLAGWSGDARRGSFDDAAFA